MENREDVKAASNPIVQNQNQDSNHVREKQPTQEKPEAKSYEL